MIDVVDLRHGYRPKKKISRKLYILQGLPNIGPVLAVRLLQHFKSVGRVMSASVDDLVSIDGIGPVKAREIKSILE
jgi:ERCC4-type nuclease